MANIKPYLRQETTQSTKEVASEPLLLGRYRQLEKLGGGGMGDVYKVYHINLKRYAAIKILNVDARKRPSIVQRFTRETELIGALDHPNVVRATDAGEEGGKLHLVMDYLVGEDMSHLVITHGVIPVPIACEVIRQSALGLDYIHQTMVHRDIKPSNLMLTSAGVVKILDLGLARMLESEIPSELTPSDQTPDGCLLGTYDYMAPEQALTASLVDGRADIYSLGCTMFRLITGQVPYPAHTHDSPSKKLLAHQQTPIEHAEGFDRIPPELRPILKKMAAKRIEDRYATGQELADAITPYCTGAQPLTLLQLESLGAKRDSGQIFAVTQRPRSTPANTHRRTSIQSVLLSRRGISLSVLIGVVLAATVSIAWMWNGTKTSPTTSSTTEINPVDGPPSPVRIDANLDKLKPIVHHTLLDISPSRLLIKDDKLSKWKWDASRQSLHCNDPEELLLEVGTTTSTHFTVDINFTQNPITGGFGIFWAYHVDDPVAMANKEHNKPFGTVEMLALHHKVDGVRDVYSLRRIRGTLTHDGRGIPCVSHKNAEKEDIDLVTAGGKSLWVEIANNRLVKAKLGNTFATELITKEPANPGYQPKPYGIGLFSAGHDVTFENVKFSNLDRNP